jgi:hypothetical protein
VAALCVINANFPEYVLGLLVFDALGDGFEFHCARHLLNRVDHCAAYRDSMTVDRFLKAANCRSGELNWTPRTESLHQLFYVIRQP